MSQSRNIVIILLVGLFGLGALYSYADTQVKEAINLVHESREVMDTSDDTNIFRPLLIYYVLSV